jgi:hypothetical protein
MLCSVHVFMLFLERGGGEMLALDHPTVQFTRGPSILSNSSANDHRLSTLLT